MLVIGNVLVSDELLEVHFRCALESCKGACCHEGDFGAPLLPEERDELRQHGELIAQQLDAEAAELLRSEGPAKYYREMHAWGTTLMPEGPCVFMVRDDQGIATCALEKAWEQGRIPVRKPVSCHLYPVRVYENAPRGFTALNYDAWEICYAACVAGRKERMPVFRFVREGLIRRFGQEFYDQLEAAWKDRYQDVPNLTGE
ncbi:MAG: DUF3109 family protein [Saprospiraceae bacterium]|nr:DUF3109 family protein [Saprospiraceae bacterium]